MALFCCLCFCLCLCHTVLSVPCSLVVISTGRPDLLAILCLMFSCAFVTFPYGVLGQRWYLIVSISDLCILPYFQYQQKIICVSFVLNSADMTVRIPWNRESLF